MLRQVEGRNVRAGRLLKSLPILTECYRESGDRDTGIPFKFGNTQRYASQRLVPTMLRMASGISQRHP